MANVKPTGKPKGKKRGPKPKINEYYVNPEEFKQELVESISQVDDQLTNLQIRKAELLESIAVGKADKTLTKKQRFLINRDLKKVEETITQLSNAKKGIKTEIRLT